MADDSDSKTEQPTSRRLAKAHDEGDISQSQEVKTAAVLLAALVLVWGLAPFVAGRVGRIIQPFLARPDSIRVDTVEDLDRVLTDTFIHLALALAAPFGMFVIVALSVALAQTGWIFTFNKIGPDLDRLNPLSGLKRLFSARSLVELVKNVAKLGIVGAVVMVVMFPQFRDIGHLPELDLAGILAFLQHLLVSLLLSIVIVFTVIAAADWFYQRFTFMQKMRMTKQEVKDEHKQTEGDPMVKARLRSLRLQRARQRMMAAVPKADVVVTNPTHYACALRYDVESMNAPVLVAKGQELVALRIRQIAEENDVPVVENPPLARALYATVELDREIPPEHYKAVAEVISYVFRLKGKMRR